MSPTSGSAFFHENHHMVEGQVILEGEFPPGCRVSLAHERNVSVFEEFPSPDAGWCILDRPC